MSTNLDVIIVIVIALLIVFIALFAWTYTKRKRTPADQAQDEPKMHESSVEVSSRELYEKGFEKESGMPAAFEEPKEEPDWQKENEEEV